MRIEYNAMQQGLELNNIVGDLAEQNRTARFLERRAEQADLLVSDYLRHMEEAETAEERDCLKPGS